MTPLSSTGQPRTPRRSDRNRKESAAVLHRTDGNREQLEAELRSSLLSRAMALLVTAGATGNLFLIAFPLSAILPVGGIMIPIVEVGIIATPVIAFIAWRRQKLRMTWAEIAVALTFLASSFGFLLADAGGEPSTKPMAFAQTLIIAWLCARAFSDPQLRKDFVWSVQVLALVALLLLARFGMQDISTGRWSYLEMNPIGVGRMFSYGAGLAVLMAVRSRGWSRIIGIVIASTSIFATALTGSSGPLGALAVSLLVIAALALLQTPQHSQAALSAFLLSGSALLAAFLLAPQYWSRIWPDFDETLNGRADLWERSWTIFGEHPLGVGFGNFLSFSPGIQDEGLRYSHNIFLEVATEGGILMLTWIFILIVWSGFALRRQTQFGDTALIGLLWLTTLLNAQVSSDIVGNRLMWVMLLIPLAAIPIRPQRSALPEGKA